MHTGFRSIHRMTPSERTEQLLPLGLLNPPGARGHRPVSRAADPRREALPTLDEAYRCPDATYAFRDATGDSFRLDASVIVAIQAASVASNEDRSATGEIVTRAWTSAWRTGLASWTNSVEDLVGAWVRREDAPRTEPLWMSLSEIGGAKDVDLLVWLPHWPEWRRLPKRAQPAAEVVPLHPSPLGIDAVHAHHDARFEDTRGPCSAYEGGLGAAFPLYKAELAKLELHIVDRGDVRHYIHIWGQDEYFGKSNLLPQASVVFVRGPESALTGFYEWMRHVELAVYPVMHDAEWAQEHDDDEYSPQACGHPSLLLSPDASVAVAVVFADDLRAVRTALVTELGCACTEDAGPDWVPALTAPYDHVLALAAGWAISDPRVGWQAWVARRPFYWCAAMTVHKAWQHALSARRWLASPQWMTRKEYPFYGSNGGLRNLSSTALDSPYHTDAVGRVPGARRIWNEYASVRHVYFAAEKQISLAADANLLIADLSRKPDLDSIYENAVPAHISAAGLTAVLFRLDSTGRILSPDFQHAMSRLPLKGNERTAWRGHLLQFSTLDQITLRKETARWVGHIARTMEWSEDGTVSLAGVPLARVHENGVVEFPGGIRKQPGELDHWWPHERDPFSNIAFALFARVVSHAFEESARSSDPPAVRAMSDIEEQVRQMNASHGNDLLRLLEDFRAYYGAKCHPVLVAIAPSNWTLVMIDGSGSRSRIVLDCRPDEPRRPKLSSNSDVRYPLERASASVKQFLGIP